MGDIADSIINGDFDSHTGEYLGPGPGYPRTRDRSLPWERRRASAQKTNEAPTFETSTNKQRQTAIGKVCTILSEKGVTGKATRRDMLRDFCTRYPGDWTAAELPALCFIINHIPGAFGDLKQFINNKNQISKNAKSSPL